MYENVDISDLEVSAAGNTIDEELADNEQLRLLQRELALLSKDYRKIIVEYYINSKRYLDCGSYRSSRRNNKA